MLATQENSPKLQGYRNPSRKRTFREGIIAAQVIIGDAETLEQAMAGLQYLLDCVEVVEAQSLVEEIKETYGVYQFLNR